MASPPVPGIDEVAARLRRALVVMLGGIPPGDDGEVPADIRLAHDIGMLGAIIGNWRARLTDPGMVAVAESAYAQTALMLGTEAAPSAGALARAVLQLADARRHAGHLLVRRLPRRAGPPGARRPPGRPPHPRPPVG